jgi:hypothetical protein
VLKVTMTTGTTQDYEARLAEFAAEEGLDAHDTKRFVAFWKKFEGRLPVLESRYARQWASRFAREVEWGRDTSTDAILLKVDGEANARSMLYRRCIKRGFSSEEAHETVDKLIDGALAYSRRKTKKPASKRCRCQR